MLRRQPIVQSKYDGITRDREMRHQGIVRVERSHGIAAAMEIQDPRIGSRAVGEVSSRRSTRHFEVDNIDVVWNRLVG